MPDMPTKRDLGITTCAYLKSIIESGADPDTWSDRLKIALNLHFSVLDTLTIKKEALQHA